MHTIRVWATVTTHRVELRGKDCPVEPPLYAAVITAAPRGPKSLPFRVTGVPEDKRGGGGEGQGGQTCAAACRHS